MSSPNTNPTVKAEAADTRLRSCLAALNVTFGPSSFSGPVKRRFERLLHEQQRLHDARFAGAVCAGQDSQGSEAQRSLRPNRLEAFDRDFRNSIALIRHHDFGRRASAALSSSYVILPG